VSCTDNSAGDELASRSLTHLRPAGCPLSKLREGKEGGEEKQEGGKGPGYFWWVGMARWRRQLASKNSGKVLVVYCSLWGIFDVQELGILAGMKISIMDLRRPQ
jgi:hypothetical protein